MAKTHILPQPFKWIAIPNKNYSIAKYPITNAQFAKFVEAGGYDERKWWTEQGWKHREDNLHYDWKSSEWKPSGQPWTQPYFWQNPKWNNSKQPVIGVSWFEAIAFCLWLSTVTNESIILPTETQWQYAAQSDDARKFPWGNHWDWDDVRANNSLDISAPSFVTTPVDKYESKSDSPFGVVDMIGNVWEWCLTDFADKSNDINSVSTSRILKGGAWYDTELLDFRCDLNKAIPPHFRHDNGIGFRIARVKT